MALKDKDGLTVATVGVLAAHPRELRMLTAIVQRKMDIHLAHSYGLL
jgi:hypothetical protein